MEKILKLLLFQSNPQKKNLDAFFYFYYLFDSLVDVLKDFEKERDKFNDKEKLDFEKFYNPFNEYILFGKEWTKKIIIRSFQFIGKLDIQPSTVIISYIFIDRLIKKNKHILTKQSLET